MKFSNKITLLLSSIIVISSVLAVLIVYYAINSILTVNIEERQKETASSVMMKIDQVMYKAYQDIRLIAHDEYLEEFFEKKDNSDAGREAKDSVHRGLLDMIYLTGPW